MRSPLEPREAVGTRLSLRWWLLGGCVWLRDSPVDWAARHCRPPDWARLSWPLAWPRYGQEVRQLLAGRKGMGLAVGVPARGRESRQLYEPPAAGCFVCL